MHAAKWGTLRRITDAIARTTRPRRRATTWHTALTNIEREGF